MTQHIINVRMENERIKELNFLLRTDTPVPLTDSRRAQLFETVFYDDFYTIQELVEQGHLEYIGHQKSCLCLRPYNSFRVYVNGEVLNLRGGELVTMSMTQVGKSEFENWLATRII